MKVTVAAIAGLCLLLIVFGYLLATRDPSGGPRLMPQDSSYAKRLQDQGWEQGVSSAPLELVEYGDFQCPTCYAEFSIINGALSQVPTLVRFRYRTYPLTKIHDKAQLAALAGEAAGRQGKFWAMHDVLFSRQPSWENDSVGTFRTITLPQYARDIQLNVEQFKQDMADASLEDGVNADVAAGDKVQIVGTPTLLLNGKSLDPLPITKEELVADIRQVAATLPSSSTSKP